MTFYTPLERLAKSAKAQGMAVAADPETVLRLCEIAQLARAVAMSNGFDAALPDKIAALRAALGTQPVKETNHG